MGFGRGGPDLRGVIRIPSAPSNNAADSTLGPIGGPSIAQDVNTLVGQKAQPFSLPDVSGAVRHIIPGQGRTIILVFHMGRY